MGPLEGISETVGWWLEQRHNALAGWGWGLGEVYLRMSGRLGPPGEHYFKRGGIPLSCSHSPPWGAHLWSLRVHLQSGARSAGR